MADLDKVDFAKQVVELQEKVKQMEEESDAQKRPKKDEASVYHPLLHSKSHNFTVCAFL